MSRPLSNAWPSLGPLAAIIIATSACGPEPTSSGPAPAVRGGGERVAASSEASVRAAYVQARQRAAGSAYDVRAEGDRLLANNAPHRFVTTFVRDTVILSEQVADGETPSWETVIAVDALGCPDELAQLDGEAAVRDADHANGVKQAHGPLTSWYLNGPLGLEQGFDVGAPPNCLADQERLTIAMTVSGLAPHLGARGDVELVDDNGVIVLRYAGLYVTDADGVELAAALRVDDHAVLIDVDAAGATFPVSIDPMWSQQDKLNAIDAAMDDQFGWSIGISGDTAIIGARQNDDAGTNSGSAYIFVRSGATWTEQQKLAPMDAAIFDQFGWSVAVSGDTAIVGTYIDDDAGSSSGGAWVFVRNGTTWTEEQKLTASDAAAGDHFGYAVSLSGDTAIVGAREEGDAGAKSGAAYVFVRSGTTWTEEQKLTAIDASSDAFFGFAVGVSGDTAIVGAHGDSGNTGAAYAFFRNGTTWTPEGKLTAIDAASDDQFGHSVSVSGDTAIIGAPANSDAGTASGSAYVFKRAGVTWAEEQKLVGTGAATGERFGWSVSVSGDRALIGAANRKAGVHASAGTAFVFLRSGATWTEDALLLALDPAPNDNLGHSVSLSGDTALVGAVFDDDTATESGSAYAFKVDGLDNGTACTLDDECTSTFCREGVCCDTACGEGVTSDCQSCLAAQTGQATDGTCDTVLASAALTCRAGSGDVCDPDEICDGSAITCPVDAIEPAATVCNQGSGDTCDPDEVCSGNAGEACPADVVEPDGTTCNVNGVCVAGECGGGSGSGGGMGGAGTGGSAASGGSGGSGGSAGANPDPPGAGCGCDVIGRAQSRSGSSWSWLLVGIAMLGRSRGSRGRREKLLARRR